MENADGSFVSVERTVGVCRWLEAQANWQSKLEACQGLYEEIGQSLHGNCPTR